MKVQILQPSSPFSRLLKNQILRPSSQRTKVRDIFNSRPIWWSNRIVAPSGNPHNGSLRGSIKDNDTIALKLATTLGFFKWSVNHTTEKDKKIIIFLEFCGPGFVGVFSSTSSKTEMLKVRSNSSIIVLPYIINQMNSGNREEVNRKCSKYVA